MYKSCCLLLLVILGFSLRGQQLFIADSASSPLNARVQWTKLAESKKFSGIAQNGIFTFPQAGTYQVKIHAVGFDDYVANLTLDRGQTIRILLVPVPVVVNDVVVTAQVGNQTAKNSVIPVKIIDSKKIALMGAQNLRDVLTNEAGIRINQDNILGSSISMQGLSGENVKILIDGVSVIGRQNGNIDLSQIDLSNVERIEIIEGPMSVNYGTNALGGVINIITKKGSSSQNSLALKTYYESIGTYNSSLTENGHIKKFTFQITGSRSFFDGWNANEKFEPLPIKHLADTNRFKTWKPKEQYSVGLNLGYKFKSWDLMLKSGYFNEYILNRGMPMHPYFEEAFDDTYKTKRFDNVFLASYSKTQGKKLNIQVAYNYYNRIKNTYFSDLTTLESQLTSYAGDQDTSKYKLFNPKISYISYIKKLHYELGADLNFESTTGQRIQNQYQSIQDLAAFAVGEYSLTDALTLRCGLRAAYNSKYAAPVLPSINLKWYINTKNIFRFSYARGFKAPGLKELYFYFVDVNHDVIGNPDLKAEESNSFNLLFCHVVMVKKALLKIEAKAFYNSVHNLITLTQIQGLSYTYNNIGIFKTKGLQLSADLSIKDIKLNAGINYTGRYNELSSSQAISAFSYSPEFNGALGYRWAKYRTQFMLYYKFNGRLPAYYQDANKNLILQYVGSYHWADFSVNKDFFRYLNIGVGVKNIFDVKSISTAYGVGVHQTDNMMSIGTGRFYFMSLSYLLKK